MADLTQERLAEEAGIGRRVVMGLEDAERKRPSNDALLKVRNVLEGRGLELLEATDQYGEGVRWRTPSGKVWIEFLRHGRVMLGFSLDDLAEKSGVGRYTIARIEGGELMRTPEQSAAKLRDALFDNGVLILGEGRDVGAGVRLRARPRRPNTSISGGSI